MRANTRPRTDHRASDHRPRRPGAQVAALIVASAAIALVAALASLPASSEPASAQVPPATEAQAQAIERQLMCPQCPNERLDTCTRPVCQDMKRIIREQLADGRTPDDIILFFEMRYGPRVRASLPVEGFNLFLYGWIAAAVAVVAAGGGWYLWSLRRRVTVGPAGPTPPPDADDGWLDAQLAEPEPRPESRRRR